MLLFIPDLARDLLRRTNGHGYRCVLVRAGVVALVMCTACASALAVTEAELIGTDLVARSVKITNMHDGVLSYFDEQRTLQNAAVDGFVQLRAIGGAEAQGTPPYPSISLRDGQRFTGDWLGPTPDGTGLRWRHDLIGTFVISLEEVTHMTWGNAGPVDTEQGAAGSDKVTLINGDALSGFVSALSDQGVALIPESGSDPVTIPYKRIASLSLANPPRTPAGLYHRVTLVDGTRLLTEDMRWSGDQAYCLVTPPGAPPMKVQLPILDLTRIDFGAGGLTLVDLSGLPMRVQDGPGVFGLVVPVRMDGHVIRAHAPAAIAFELPPGAERFAATAELDTADAPGHAADWADFHVVVSSDSTEIGRAHVTGEQPVVDIIVPASGRKLMIRLEPGVNGPILDRLLLRDAVVLLRETPAGQTGNTGH